MWNKYFIKTGENKGNVFVCVGRSKKWSEEKDKEDLWKTIKNAIYLLAAIAVPVWNFNISVHRHTQYECHHLSPMWYLKNKYTPHICMHTVNESITILWYDVAAWSI